jgi:hypothetical protein
VRALKQVEEAVVLLERGPLGLQRLGVRAQRRKRPKLLVNLLLLSACGTLLLVAALGGAVFFRLVLCECEWANVRGRGVRVATLEGSSLWPPFVARAIGSEVLLEAMPRAAGTHP